MLSLHFISSLLIVIAAIKSFSRFLRWNGILLITVSMIYACFCFMAFGKRVGINSTILIEYVIAQQGLDPSSLPLPLAVAVL